MSLDYGRVRIKFGDFNIGELLKNSPIANINSSPINYLVRYCMFTSILLKYNELILIILKTMSMVYNNGNDNCKSYISCLRIMQCKKQQTGICFSNFGFLFVAFSLGININHHAM